MAQAKRARALVRQPYWERRLVAWAEANAGSPYVWGSTDCASLAFAAVGVIIGAELPDVPRYDSATGAMRTMAECGGIREHLLRWGLREFPITLAQQGDIIVRPADADSPLEAASVLVSGRRLCAVEDLGVHWSSVRDSSAVAMRI